MRSDMSYCSHYIDDKGHRYKYEKLLRGIICMCGHYLKNPEGGNTICDSPDGPCACGAWHNIGEEIHGGIICK